MNMKALYSTLFVLLCLTGYAQHIKGLQIITPVTERTVTFEDLNIFKSHSMDSLRIYNHAGHYRSTLHRINGVALKDILAGIPLGEESAKVLSEYYIVCIAEDGYKVVFSWNELFNSPVGNSVMVVTQLNGSTTSKQDNGIVLLSPEDYATGRRYVKQLKSFKISRIKI